MRYEWTDFAKEGRDQIADVVDGLSKMVYRVEADVIYIAAMWDCRREPQVQSEQVK